MSVYYKENAEYLRESIASIFKQTVQTNDFVLVCDGVLTDDLYSVIEFYETKHAEVFHVIKKDKNEGLGNALNLGLKHCCNELVARMDSDDISRPDRCEKQLKIFAEYNNIDVVSGTIEEFDGNRENITSRRVVPETNEQIRKFAKTRNPINHPCVMYKASSVLNAGGYIELYLLEDYYLWIRMLQNGALAYNIQEPILWMRAGAELYKRRSGIKYAVSQERLFNIMRRTGYINFNEYLKSVTLRTCSALAPNPVRQFAFNKLLRKSE